MVEIIVVGIGNPYRGDDAAGWAVIDALEGRVNGLIQLDKQRGGIAELLDIFGKHTNVFLVDACLPSSHIGSWVRIDALRQPLPLENAQTSTHGLSVSQAIALAENLDQLPAKLIIYAISGDHFNITDSLSPVVAKAVSEVANALLNEEDISRCMNSI